MHPCSCSAIQLHAETSTALYVPVVDDLCTVPQAAKAAGVAPNTLRGWIVKHGLSPETHGGKDMLRLATVRVFAQHNPQLRAASRAAAALTPPAGQAPDAPAGAVPVAAGADEDRDGLRALRARVATLDEQLDLARAETVRLRQERDLWRDRAGAHRASLRAQLDLEVAADRTTR